VFPNYDDRSHFLHSATRCMPENPENGDVVTVVVHKLGVIDLAWNSKLDKWVLKRVVHSLLPPEPPAQGA
jgi:hypothetical protein